MSRAACLGSSAEIASSPSQSHAALAETLARRPLDVYEAVAYLDEVRAQFHTRPEVYSAFLALLDYYKDARIETRSLIDRATALFSGHPQLIRRLEVFLPADYRLEGTTWQRVATDAQPPLARLDAAGGPLDAAIDYVNRVKIRFADEPDNFNNFLGILQAYTGRGGQSDYHTILHDVTKLFRGHEDLLEEFKRFSPSDRGG